MPRVAVEFMFAPLDSVVVTAFGLNYPGRVARVAFEPGRETYTVDYVVEGEIRRGDFHADELRGRGWEPV